MKKLIILFVIALIAGCTTQGVEKRSASEGDVFSYQGIYLKRIKIDGDRIYLFCDEDGDVLLGQRLLTTTYTPDGKTYEYNTVLDGSHAYRKR